MKQKNPTQQRLLEVTSCYLLATFIAYTFLKYMNVKFYPDPNMGLIFQDLEAWSGIAWVNPYFRYFTGALEAMASVILFVPGLQLAGALLTIGTLVTALLLHVVGPIGLEGARGALAAEALVCTLFAAWIVWVRRRELLELTRFLLVDRVLTDRRLALG